MSETGPRRSPRPRAAEAASGIGSAFFCAGTRALLVTNWSVRSASTRELITDVFLRQGADPGLSREALRQTMIALFDGPGAVDAAGNMIFTFAHPLFWAAYPVIGDGRQRKFPLAWRSKLGQSGNIGSAEPFGPWRRPGIIRSPIRTSILLGSLRPAAPGR